MNAFIWSLDIDECSQSIGNLCAFQCENVPGSYKCVCPPHGYTMSPNGRTCEGKSDVILHHIIYDDINTQQYCSSV